MFVVLCVSLCVCVICCVHLIMQEPENECHFCFHYFCQKKINRQVSFHTFPPPPILSQKNAVVFSYFINPFTSFLSPLLTKMQLKHTSIFTCNLSLETRLITQHNIHITTPSITHWLFHFYEKKRNVVKKRERKKCQNNNNCATFVRGVNVCLSVYNCMKRCLFVCKYMCHS